MTREQALELLGLADGCDHAAIRAAYDRALQELARRRSAVGPTELISCDGHAARLRAAWQLLLVRGSPAPPPPLSQTQKRDLPVRDPRRTGDLPGSLAATAEPLLDAELPEGTVLAGRFEVRRRLGCGGMGVVYAAFDRSLGDEVAVKLLLPHLLCDPEARERFRLEAHVAGGLAHPNVVRVHELHEDGGRTFLAMELLRGRNLREEISHRAAVSRRFSVEEIRRVGAELCAALQEAHKRTVHRDVKPENVWVCEDGSVKLMDFGIARLAHPAPLTATGLALGTAYYMAPEQLRGDKEVDHRADQYAVAVVLYELLTGQVPQGAVEPPHRLRKNVPVALSEAVMRALARESARRFADMDSLARALTAGPRSRSRLAAVAVTAVLLTGIAALLARPRTAETVGGDAPVPVASGGSGQKAAVGPESQAAKVEYKRRVRILDARRQEAEKAEGELFGDEAASAAELKRCIDELARTRPDTPDVRRHLEQQAEQLRERSKTAAKLADLWRKNQQAAPWRVTATGHIGAAEALAEAGDYAQAVTELGQAEARYLVPANWRRNARETLSLLRERSQLFSARLASVRQAGRPSGNLVETARRWHGLPAGTPEALEQLLLAGDGSEAVPAATRARDFLISTAELSQLRDIDLVLQLDALGRWEPVPALAPKCLAVRECVTRGDGELSRGRTEQAAALYREAQRLFANAAAGAGAAAERLAADARAATDGGRHPEAVRLATEALAIKPDCAAAFTARGLGHQRQNDFGPAIAHFSRAIELDPNDSGAYIHRAASYMQLSDYERAMADLTKATEVSPNNPDVWFWRAWYVRKPECNAQVVADLTKAIELKCGFTFHVYLLRGEAHRQLGVYGAAIADLTKAIEQNPKDGATYRLRGIANAQDASALRRKHLGEPLAKAVADLKESIKLNPNDAEAHLNLGIVYAQMKDYGQAAKHLTTAVDRKAPDQFLALAWRGIAYRNLEQNDSAINDLSQAHKLKPEVPWVLDERAKAYRGKGDQERERTDTEAATRLRTPFRRAKFTLDGAASPTGSNPLGATGPVPPQ